jgi:heme A synthase
VVARARTAGIAARTRRRRPAAGDARVQIALGIATLVNVVPLPLAAAHQAGALCSCSRWRSTSRMRFPPSG